MFRMTMASTPKTLVSLTFVLMALTSSSSGQDEPLQAGRVAIPPIITTHPEKKIIFKEGESVEIPCVASGQPEPTYRWELNKVQFDPSGTDGRVTIQPGVGTLVFARTTERDEGFYQCIAENTAGVAVSNTELKMALTIPPMITTHPEKEIIFKEGQSVEIPCVASGQPEPTYRWELNKVRFDPSGTDGRVTIQPGVGTLVFARTTERDEGFYQCIAENTAGVAVSNTELKMALTIPPIITTHPEKEIFFKEGQSVEIPCVASGQPEPTYRWELNKVRFDPSGTDGRVTIKPGVGTLVFARTTERDEGIYQCLAENTAGVAVSYIVELKMAFLKSFPNRIPIYLYPSLGDSVTLQCIPPRSQPEPEVNWVIYRHGADLTPVNLTDRVSIDPQGNLHLANTVESDFQEGGTYACNVYNRVTEQTVQGAYATILPQGRVPSRHAPSLMWQDAINQVSVMGDEVRITCIFSGSPTPQVTWERADHPMPPRKREGSFGQELIIENVQLEDQGRYECIGKNDDVNVQIRRYFNLIVQVAPFFTIRPQSVNVREGGTATIECQGSGLPQPIHIWQINHTPVAEMPPNPRVQYNPTSIQIFNVTMDDTQVVQCNITNKHGYDFVNAYVNVISD